MRSSLPRQLTRFVDRPLRRFATLAGVSLLAGGAQSAALVAIGVVAARLTGPGDASVTLGPLRVVGESETLLWVAGVALSLALLFGVLAADLSARIGSAATQRGRMLILRGYLRSSFDVQVAEPRGRLHDLVSTHVARITQGLALITQGITAAASLAVLVGTAFVVSPISSLGVVLVVAGLVATLYPISRSQRRDARQQAVETRAFFEETAELIELSKDLKVFGVEDAVVRNLDARTAELQRLQRRLGFKNRSLTASYQALALGLLVIGLAVVTSVGLTSRAVASFGVPALLMLRSITYGQQLQGVVQGLLTVTPSIELLRDAEDRYGACTHGIVSSRSPTSIREVRLVDAGYSYPDGTRALVGISLTLRRGEQVALVGRSGAGKSTLADVLLGLLEPTEGSMLVDGVPVGGSTRSSWSSRVAHVPQRPTFLTGTIAQNIALFRDVSMSDIREAAESAGILDDIQLMPQGFETELSGLFGKMSGGQLQRIAIARALVARPHLLILDEPTSALDEQLEQVVSEALAAVRDDMITVIVSHRPTPIANCDRVIHLAAGRVVRVTAPNVVE